MSTKLYFQQPLLNRCLLVIATIFSSGIAQAGVCDSALMTAEVAFEHYERLQGAVYEYAKASIAASKLPPTSGYPYHEESDWNDPVVQAHSNAAQLINQKLKRIGEVRTSIGLIDGDPAQVLVELEKLPMNAQYYLRKLNAETGLLFRPIDSVTARDFLRLQQQYEDQFRRDAVMNPLDKEFHRQSLRQGYSLVKFRNWAGHEREIFTPTWIKFSFEMNGMEFRAKTEIQINDDSPVKDDLRLALQSSGRPTWRGQHHTDRHREFVVVDGVLARNQDPKQPFTLTDLRSKKPLPNVEWQSETVTADSAPLNLQNTYEVVEIYIRAAPAAR